MNQKTQEIINIYFEKNFVFLEGIATNCLRRHNLTHLAIDVVTDAYLYMTSTGRTDHFNDKITISGMVQNIAINHISQAARWTNTDYRKRDRVKHEELINYNISEEILDEEDYARMQMEYDSKLAHIRAIVNGPHCDQDDRILFNMKFPSDGRKVTTQSIADKTRIPYTTTHRDIERLKKKIRDAYNNDTNN